MERKCKNCLAFDGKFCKFSPPTPMVTGMQPSALNPRSAQPIISAVFPPMSPDDWCLQFRPNVARMIGVDAVAVDTVTGG